MRTVYLRVLKTQTFNTKVHTDYAPEIFIIQGLLIFYTTHLVFEHKMRASQRHVLPTEHMSTPDIYQGFAPPPPADRQTPNRVVSVF